MNAGVLLRRLGFRCLELVGAALLNGPATELAPHAASSGTLSWAAWSRADFEALDQGLEILATTWPAASRRLRTHVGAVFGGGAALVLPRQRVCLVSTRVKGPAAGMNAAANLVLVATEAYLLARRPSVRHRWQRRLIARRQRLRFLRRFAAAGGVQPESDLAWYANAHAEEQAAFAWEARRLGWPLRQGDVLPAGERRTLH